MTEPSEAQRRNLELARDGFERWITGDREGAIAAFADDVEVYVPSELGNAGSYRGLDEFGGWIEAWEEAWEEFTMGVAELEPVGERHVIAEVNSTGTGLASGLEVGNTLGWVLGVRDGKLEYLCLQPTLEAARAHALERESG